MTNDEKKMSLYDFSIVDLLDSALDDEAKEVTTRTYNPMRPSSAGKCARALSFELQEYKGLAPVTLEERDGKVHRLLDLGHWLESHMIKFMYKLNKAYDLMVKYKQQVVTTMTLDDGTIIEEVGS